MDCSDVAEKQIQTYDGCFRGSVKGLVKYSVLGDNTRLTPSIRWCPGDGDTGAAYCCTVYKLWGCFWSWMGVGLVSSVSSRLSQTISDSISG